jgi:transglutaminase-like putative cysteine protease
MMSWKDFGKFVYSLKVGRDQLPDNIKQTVHQLADGLTDPKQKISRLYEYMQKNTRYVGIQLGIGGWQPFDAKYVATNGYGDCKALVNYMYSLLKEAGINSYYTLVRAGKYANYITTEFPSQQFNHVILCVPLQKDTVRLSW